MFEKVLFLYYILCAVLLGLRHYSDKREWWVRFSLVAALPVVGFLLPPFWPERLRRSARGDSFELTDQIYKDDVLPDVLHMPEVEKEMNVVPLEEALLVNDLSTRRKVMIDLLKQDSMEHLEVLRLAIANEDTETSHYAVSAIMEIKRKLTLTLQELAVKYEENKSDPYLLRSYAEVLKNYMRSGFLDERTLLKHKYTYSGLLGSLTELAPDDAAAYLEKINVDLELGEFAAAEKTAKTLLQVYPRNEDAYLSLMKVYFTVRSHSQLKETLQELKRSPVRLSSKALTMVRFWSEGA